jgi:hypothetical protein
VQRDWWLTRTEATAACCTDQTLPGQVSALGRDQVAPVASGPVSTRRLIIAALLCGLAIVVAFTVQVLLVV